MASSSPSLSGALARERNERPSRRGPPLFGDSGGAPERRLSGYWQWPFWQVWPAGAGGAAAAAVGGVGGLVDAGAGAVGEAGGAGGAAAEAGVVEGEVGSDDRRHEVAAEGLGGLAPEGPAPQGVGAAAVEENRPAVFGPLGQVAGQVERGVQVGGGGFEVTDGEALGQGSGGADRHLRAIGAVADGGVVRAGVRIGLALGAAGDARAAGQAPLVFEHGA